MRIDYGRVLLTTVCLSAAALSAAPLLHADLSFNASGQLTIGGGNMSADLEESGSDLAMRAHLNLSATADAETPDFSNVTSSARQSFGKKANQTDAVSAMFVDDLAEIRIYRDDGVHPIMHWTVHRLLSARELNTTGNDTLAVFDKNGSSWSVAADGMYNGMNCTIRQISAALTFVANTSIQVPINVTAYIFNNDYTLTFKGQNITASFQTVKFSYSFGAWPFQSGSQGLAVLALVKSTGMGTKSSSDDATVFAGEASVMIPTIATEDGADVNVSVNVQYKAFTGNARSAMVIEWDFPVYLNSLMYDPVMGMTDTTPVTTTAPATTTEAPSSTPAMSNYTVPASNYSAPVTTTASVKGGVSSLAVSVLSTVLLLALAMNSA